MKAVAAKIIFAILIFSFVFLATSLTPTEQGREEKISAAFHDYFERHAIEMLDALHAFRDDADAYSKMDSAGLTSLRDKFRELRSLYKLIEPLSCYYFIASERNFNGPVVPEIEDE